MSGLSDKVDVKKFIFLYLPLIIKSNIFHMPIVSFGQSLKQVTKHNHVHSHKQVKVHQKGSLDGPLLLCLVKFVIFVFLNVRCRTWIKNVFILDVATILNTQYKSIFMPIFILLIQIFMFTGRRFVYLFSFCRIYYKNVRTCIYVRQSQLDCLNRVHV